MASANYIILLDLMMRKKRGVGGASEAGALARHFRPRLFSVPEVDDSERENNARTDNHENSCSHDGFILICAARRAPTHSQKARMNGAAGFGTLSAKDETKNNHKVKSGGQERPPHTTTTW
jgi:hypothetical protein